MKKYIFFMLLVSGMASWLLGQNSPALLTIGDDQVTLEEFERIFRKNNNETSLNRQTPEEYLDLFINFKLKVKEAEALGMDTTSKFINELEGYRAQLAKPYLADDESKKAMLTEAFERSKLDIKASHILIKLPANSTPEDTLAAYEKALEIRERIINGEAFEIVAKATSDDASVQRNGGNLSYFTVFSMIYPFETMAYSTQVGELSMPFRTTYGYHILKVYDKRPARGQIKVAHIFIRTPEGMGESEREGAYEKAQVLYDSLQMGVDFSQLATNHSEDPGSARTGGEIPWFGTGRMIPEFEDACFAIEEKGGYTKPLKSYYGWHIIKLIDKKEIGTYEEMEAGLHEKINRGDRGKQVTARYISKLKDEYGFRENPETLDPIYAAVDSSLLMGAWRAGELKELKAILLSIGKRVFTSGEFARYIEMKQNKGKYRDPRGYVNQMYQEFSQEIVMKHAESQLPVKYPEFRHIYQEYHDGILLFDIMDQKVWSKAVSDTLGLVSFHQNHRTDYMWKPRTDAYMVTCGKKVELGRVRKAYKKILKGKLDQDALNDEYCSNDTVPCITLTRLLVEEGENELVDALKGKSGPGPVLNNGDTDSFVILINERPPEPKALEDARGQITSDYQNYLEAEWLKTLKEKYPVKVDRDILSRIK